MRKSTKAPRYKNASQQKIYDSLLKLADDPKSELYKPDGTPRGGANVRLAFWDGVAGVARNGVPPGHDYTAPLQVAAFQAGKEFARRTKKSEGAKGTQGAQPSNLPKPPVTLRLDDEHRQVLEHLAQQASHSDVLRRGLRMVANAEAAASAPLYAQFVDDKEIAQAIEDAARAACEVLDGLFPKGTPAESRGISSNFQGTLEEHIRAMLTGKSAATWSHHRHIPALFGDDRALGRIRSAADKEGYTVVRQAMKMGEADQYYDSDRRAFVPLEQVSVGALFTGEDYARKEVFAWLREEGKSPQDLPLKLCLLSWERDGALELAAVAI